MKHGYKSEVMVPPWQALLEPGFGFMQTDHGVQLLVIALYRVTVLCPLQDLTFQQLLKF